MEIFVVLETDKDRQEIIGVYESIGTAKAAVAAEFTSSREIVWTDYLDGTSEGSAIGSSLTYLIETHLLKK